MARKRLIKGANAARVEERIARVPADMSAASSSESSIFDALRALEVAPTAQLAPAAPKMTPKAAALPQKKTAPAKKKAAPKEKTAHAPQEAAPLKAAEPRMTHPLPEPSRKQDLGAKPSRLSPSDFSAVEREAIVRCCSDYKNRLPTYLLAVQKEVKVLDSVIEKCQSAAKGHPRKSST